MYYYVDESGNTGLNIFDPAQPKLFYGVLCCSKNLDIIAAPLLSELRAEVGERRIHANHLGVGKLTKIAERITRFSKQHDVRFSLLRITKRDHAIITFFDQVFDSHLNDALGWQHYNTPLRYPLLMKMSHLFDEQIARDAWGARCEQNPQRCAERLKAVCTTLLSRTGRLPDQRSQELISGALRWTISNPEKVHFGQTNRDSVLQISPNLVGFQQVLITIAKQSSRRKRAVRRIVVDRQNQFNGAQAELADIYERMRIIGHTSDHGPGMPKLDYSQMPAVPPTFLPGDESPGLELVDVTLWTVKKMEERKAVSPELRALALTQLRRGYTDEVSLEAINERWRFLLDMPEGPISEEVKLFIQQQEERRLAALDGL